MPHLEPTDGIMLADLVEMGVCEHGGASLSWATIGAWAALTGARVTGQDVALLRALSAAYVAQYRSASAEGALPPDHEA